MDVPEVVLGPAEAPRLSVVIAAYDAEATLPAQLAALAEQWPGFDVEVIVADNGSTDETVSTALAAAHRLPGLRVVDASARRGPAAARNIGAAAARGRFLAFCDADDVVGDAWVGAVCRALETHAFVAGSFEGRLLNSDSVLRSRTLPQQHGLQVSDRRPDLRHAGAGNMGIRADVFRQVGGFDESAPCLEDTDLCWRVQLAGVPLAFVPEMVVHVRLRVGLRSVVRQGYAYGVGERWLVVRHGGPVPGPERPGPVEASDGAAASPSQPPPPRARRRGRARAVASVVRDLAHVRRAGELAAVLWSVGWGIGFATGVVPDVPGEILGGVVARASEPNG